MLIRIIRASGIFAALICSALFAEDRRVLDRKDLQAFLDPLVSGTLQKRNIPGAVVVVVQNEQILFAKGYGLANLESRTPVDPPIRRSGIRYISELNPRTPLGFHL